MNADDNDKLWELLGKARKPEVSPFFSRNVLRTLRQEEEAQPRMGRAFFSKLRRWAWRTAIASVCAVAALIAVFPNTIVRHHHAAPVETGIATQVADNPADYEVVKHLDELVADEESSVWLDDSPAR
jgi:anti-sigma-K factor RskA